MGDFSGFTGNVFFCIGLLLLCCFRSIRCCCVDITKVIFYSSYDRQPIIHVFFACVRISELVERETEEYHKADPDPFDDRHPGRADPECMLGHLLKILFKNDDFTNAVRIEATVNTN